MIWHCRWTVGLVPDFGFRYKLGFVEDDCLTILLGRLSWEGPEVSRVTRFRCAGNLVRGIVVSYRWELG